MARSSRIDQLQQWESELSGEQEQVSQALEPLLVRSEQLAKQIDHVRSLIALESPDGREERTAAKPQSRLQASGNTVQNAVKELLHERRQPMHIREIREELIRRGIPIPGKGTEANIIVHLRRAPDLFARKGRGIYTVKRQRNED